jgi:AcrR family transcriptional regulator
MEASLARPVVKRAPIEEAAIHLFAARGVAETTVKDIASRAGVAEGALYRHYASKNEMAWRLFTREVEKFSRQFEGVLFAPGRSIEMRLLDGVRFIYGYYRDKPVEFSFILLTQHGFPEKELLDDRFNPNDMVIRFVTEAMKRREAARGDPVLLAALLMGAVLQPLAMHRYGRLKKEPIGLVGEVAKSCLGLLRKGKAALR